MGYYWKPYETDFEDFLKWLFANRREREIIENVPKYCRKCDALGLCRDEKNNWKCRNGCWFINK